MARCHAENWRRDAGLNTARYNQGVPWRSILPLWPFGTAGSDFLRSEDRLQCSNARELPSAAHLTRPHASPLALSRPNSTHTNTRLTSSFGITSRTGSVADGTCLALRRPRGRRGGMCQSRGPATARATTPASPACRMPGLPPGPTAAKARRAQPAPQGSGGERAVSWRGGVGGGGAGGRVSRCARARGGAAAALPW